MHIPVSLVAGGKKEATEVFLPEPGQSTTTLCLTGGGSDVESPPAQTHQTDEEKGKSASWKVLSNSIRGRSHEESGEPCQDAYWIAESPNGILIAAVSDGAGSAKFPDIGSQVATQVAVNEISEALSASTLTDSQLERILRESVMKARQAVAQEAKAKESKPRDFAATLIVVIASVDFVAAAQIGDGAVVVDKEDDSFYVTLTQPDTGEFANHTTFLTSRHAEQHLQIKIWRGQVRRIALFTDGIQRQVLEKKENAWTPHHLFFTTMFRFLDAVQSVEEGNQGLQTFLTSERIRALTEDDVTLLLASAV